MGAKKDLTREKAFRILDNPGLAVDVASRTVDLAFASSYPVERWDYREILDMQGMSMARVGSGRAALLMDHNTRDQVGVIEAVSIGSDNVARAKVRFSQSARGQEIFQDVQDGIRSLVSVGYTVNEVRFDGTKDGLDEYLVTSWEPYEISIVSVPADPTVFVGRSADMKAISGKELPTQEPSGTAPENDDATGNRGVELAQTRAQETQAERVEPTPKSPEIVIEKGPTKMDEIEKERKRTADILALGEKFNHAAAAREFIASGKSVDEFREHILNSNQGVTIKTPVAESGMSDVETRAFSVRKLMLASATGDWKDAGLERAACEAAAKSLGRQAKGFFLPTEYLVRASDMVVGTPEKGGNLVANELRASSFIEALQARLMINRMGATVLDGLTGNLSIPKELTSAVAGWVGEDGVASRTGMTVGQIGVKPHTATAKSEISRRMLLQSSLSAEALITKSLQGAIARAIDMVSIKGGGASEPVGLLGGRLSAGRKIDVALADKFAWGDIVDLETMVATADADFGSLGYLTNAKIRGDLKQTQFANSLGFIWSNGADGMGQLNGYNAGVTSQMPAETMIFGNWADLILAFWSGTDILVDQTTSDSGSHIVKVYQDVDVAVAREESFAYAVAA